MRVLACYFLRTMQRKLVFLSFVSLAISNRSTFNKLFVDWKKLSAINSTCSEPIQSHKYQSKRERRPEKNGDPAYEVRPFNAATIKISSE